MNPIRLFFIPTAGHLCSGVAIALLLSAWPCGVAAAEIDFARDIRPLLSDNCFACHGPDREARKARLRLDDSKVALKKVVVPYKPDESPLIERLLTADEDAVSYTHLTLPTILLV